MNECHYCQCTTVTGSALLKVPNTIPAANSADVSTQQCKYGHFKCKCNNKNTLMCVHLLKTVY